MSNLISQISLSTTNCMMFRLSYDGVIGEGLLTLDRLIKQDGCYTWAFIIINQNHEL